MSYRFSPDGVHGFDVNAYSCGPDLSSNATNDDFNAGE